MALAVATNAWALPSYQIVPLGLFDAEHTLSGSHSSNVLRVSASGYVTGSARGNGGDSAWFYDPATGTTTRIGLFDGENVSSYGDYYSSAGSLTETGYVIGRSDRYTSAGSGGGSAWLYDASSGTTARLGYFDAAHTRSDGIQNSSANWLRAAGWVAGRSIRYAATGTDPFGETAWLYDASGATTTRLGFFDAEHTRSDGYQYSFVGTITESGYITGTSRRSGGTANLLGESAWLYDISAATTARLGFFDAAHTRSDGTQYSGATVRESGYVSGYSTRYAGMANLGETLWLRNPMGATLRIGLFDADHTRSDGYQFSDGVALADSGHSVGTSERFDGATPLGSSAWFSDAAGTTTRIGLFDAEHTRNDGFQFNSTTYLTESGFATGSAGRFDGAADLGQSAWVYDAATGSTIRAGFYDSAHTRDDGYQFSYQARPTESGYVLGHSYRFNGPPVPPGGVSDGQSAWLYDASTASTTLLGFYDSAHTLSNGNFNSRATNLTESGYAAGYSGWGSQGLARSAWIHDASTEISVRVGLLDAVHTRGDGNQVSAVSLLSESGWAAGGSSRYAGMASRGTTAWVYHVPTDTIDTIVLSTRSDGSAFASVSFLSDDGLALGSYTLYGSDDSDLGRRAFAWTAADGAVDLGALVESGLTAEGWSYLADAIRADGLGQIVGAGRLSTGGDLAYLLAPIPEPGTNLLTLIGLLGLAHRNRRRLG